MTWLVPLLTSLAIGGGLVGVGFAIGCAYEREQPVAPQIHLPVRRCSGQARHVRTLDHDGGSMA